MSMSTRQSPSATTTAMIAVTADPDVSALDIDVDVSRGVVTLSGDVPGNAQVADAVRLARSTDGVRSVTNKLDVTKTSAR